MTVPLESAQLEALKLRGKMLCNLWKVTRRDGVVLRFTDLPKPFVFIEDGGAYLPGGSGNVSSERREAGLRDSNMDIIGVFDSDRITADDIRSGAYKEARIDHWIVAFGPGPGRWVRHSVKWIRDVGYDGEIYTAASEGRARFLQRPVGGRFGGSFSPTCTFVLGDANTCKADITGTTINSSVDTVVSLSGNLRLEFTLPEAFPDGALPTIASSTVVEVIASGGLNRYRIVSGQWDRTPIPDQLIDVSGRGISGNDGTKTVVAADSTTIDVAETLTTESVGPSTTITRQFENDYFREGEVVWTSGANADRGVISPIVGYTHTTKTVQLLLPTPLDISVGDGFTIKPGCDGLESTCRKKFFPVGGTETQPGGNIVNFGGSPFDPGSDATVNPDIPT